MKTVMSRRLDAIRAKQPDPDKPWRRIILHTGEPEPELDPAFNWIIWRIVHPSKER